MSGIIAQPGSIKKVAAAAFFKIRNTGYDKEECKGCLKALSDDLDEYVNWIKGSKEQKLKEIEYFVMTQKKQKALDNINYNMRVDNTLAMIEIVAPMAAKVRKAYKAVLKEDKVPDDVKVELTTIMYLVDRLNIAGWNKLKKQLLVKYGNDWMTKVEEKKKNVDEKVLEFIEYKPKEKIVRDRYKEFEDAWKLKLKKEEEELSIEELSDDVETESDTQIRDAHNLDDIDSDNLSPVVRVKKEKKALKKGKKDSDSESSSESSSDSDSDSSSEEEKKPAKKEKKPAKKESSSDSDSDSDSESEEEKKPAKKESSSESSSDSDSDSESEKEKKPAKKDSSSESSSDSDSDSESEKEKKPAKKDSSSDSDSDSDSDSSSSSD